MWRYTTFYVYYALLLVAVILSCLTDQPPLFSQAVKDKVRLPDAGTLHAEALIGPGINVGDLITSGAALRMLGELITRRWFGLLVTT